MTITPEDLVRREVHYCVSYLVSTLADGFGAQGHGGRELSNLIEQAIELASPLLDYEEAAREAGWRFEDDQWLLPNTDGDAFAVDTAEAAADVGGFDPYEREVYEHWIVSEWLADKLAAKGEKVDKDFAGMVVWARTTIGQGIASDWVLEEITKELNNA